MIRSLLVDIGLGADPELFVKDIKTGKFVPSLDLIGAGKYAPKPLSIPGFSVLEDNVLAEYNIPPSKTKEMFRENIRLGMKLFDEVLPPDKYVVEIASSYKFTPEQLLDPRANEFGCEPDKNAWKKGETNRPPAIPEDGLRVAGGHIHVGYSIDADAMGLLQLDAIDRDVVNQEIVKWMDVLLAVPAMRIDKDTERRRLYGKAGSYRDKPYGMEYRTLSSFWLSSNSLIDWVWDMTNKAVTKTGNIDLVDAADEALIIDAINNNNTKAIDELFEKYELTMF